MNTYFYKQIGKAKTDDDLVLGNLRLVVHLAKRYQGMGLSLEDLINEGTIGLCQARDKYESNKGTFSTYAALWIKATIRQALNNKSRMIRVPSHRTHIEEGIPKISELNSTYQGFYNPQIDIKYENEHVRLKINALLEKLKPKQREIIKMKFGIGYDEMKTTDIAKELNLTVQAVNGNIRNALVLMQSS